LKDIGNRIGYWIRLTRLPPALMAALVEMARSPLTMGVSHLFNFGSPFLNSSNAWDCSLNIARISSDDWHLSMAAARGWLRRSLPVLLVYMAKAASKRASKLDRVGIVFDVFEAEDMVL
jgi:hypothetical protein